MFERQVKTNISPRAVLLGRRVLRSMVDWLVDEEARLVDEPLHGDKWPTVVLTGREVDTLVAEFHEVQRQEQIDEELRRMLSDEA